MFHETLHFELQKVIMRDIIILLDLFSDDLKGFIFA